jgi:hypothetical protein
VRRTRKSSPLRRTGGFDEPVSGHDFLVRLTRELRFFAVIICNRQNVFLAETFINELTKGFELSETIDVKRPPFEWIVLIN